MLSPTQIELRKGLLTSTRMKCLMEGDAPAILQLYYEMTDDPAFEPVDLSGVWPVQLGTATEQLNLDWFERKNRMEITRRGEVIIHPRYNWAAATLDGWIEALGCPVECKHVGGREPLEVVVDRYWPQMGWQMEVTGATQCALSIIMGASEPIVDYFDRDAPYASEMIHRGAQFMDCVARRIMPVQLAPIPAPVVVSKDYDFLGDNRWASAAATWLTTKVAARDHVEAEKCLKELVPPDAKKCTGYGVAITRNRIGHLSLREII